MRIKRILLKHERDVAFGRHFVRYDAPLDHHVAAIGPLQAGDQTQRRRLSRTGRAQQHDKFAVREGERKATDRLDGAVALADIYERDLSHGTLLHKALRAAPVRSSRRTKGAGPGATRVRPFRRPGPLCPTAVAPLFGRWQLPR